MTTESTKSSRRPAVERRLAPHVDERWTQRFIVELRLLGVNGTQIGAALSEVESHCSESGQSTQVAFGTPVEYARSLKLPTDSDRCPRTVLRSLVPVSVQVLGTFILIWSAKAWLRGQILEVTAGHVVVATAFLLTVTALVRYAVSVLRLAVKHQRLFPAISVSFAFLTGIATCLFALKFLDQVIWRAYGGWGVAAGATAISGGILWTMRCRGPRGYLEDPITSPFDHELRAK